VKVVIETGDHRFGRFVWSPTDRAPDALRPDSQISKRETTAKRFYGRSLPGVTRALDLEDLSLRVLLARSKYLKLRFEVGSIPISHPRNLKNLSLLEIS